MRNLLLILAGALSAAGQTASPIMESLRPRYHLAKLNLVEAAEMMPESEYRYRLTPPQRSFAEWIEHNIGMNYSMCGAALNAKAPVDPKTFHGVTAKAELVQGLKDSFAFCDPLYEDMTDARALETVTPPQGKPFARVNHMIGLVVNWNQHYGNLVGYLRTKGITPPSTARAQKEREKQKP
jgi:hypothetical protein